ncbi:uncharacterized protein [Macrobrachium rosenbergii]|uniref:uncharacterized protein n=1 Tax=Macrobrachium rosenbergii TaxID=79674 RepID=UPI0034D5561A
MQGAISAIYSHQVPPGEGEHFMVVAAGTNDGLTKSSYMCYRAKTTRGDYHREMNAKLFQQWLMTQLLPPLPEPSVLVPDNALHQQPKRWLEQRRISIPPASTRPELLLICQQNQPEHRYEVDNTIHKWGHRVVRLPPAHPELSAIKQVWERMKWYKCSSLCRFTWAHPQARLQEAMISATPEV